MTFAGWSPDFPDPVTYLDMFITDGTQNKMKYSNPKYDEIITKAKTDGSDVKARWNSLLEAEKILMDDAAIAPVYQRSAAYLQRGTVKDIYKHNYGGDLSFKWASVGK